MPVTSIAEAREIIRIIKKEYNYDFSIYSLTSFRYKLDKTIAGHFFKNPGLLISRLIDDKEFFDEFLYNISVPSNELFRDPGLWKDLKNNLLPDVNPGRKMYVWFPDLVAGNELFSFLILLHKINSLNHFRIFVSSLSKKSIKNISTGYINRKALEQGLENYTNIFSDNEFRSFLNLKDGNYYIDSGLTKSVSFSLHNLELKPAPNHFNIIFFRNKLINYSWEFQNQLLGFFVETLKPGGLLITGYQEEVVTRLSDSLKMEVFNKEERIYRKT